MLADVVLHWTLDMSGAVTFACIMGRCNNPEHNHGRLLRWVGSHPWLAQSATAIVLACVTVRVIG